MQINSINTLVTGIPFFRFLFCLLPPQIATSSHPGFVSQAGNGLGADTAVHVVLENRGESWRQV